MFFGMGFFWSMEIVAGLGGDSIPEEGW